MLQFTCAVRPIGPSVSGHALQQMLRPQLHKQIAVCRLHTSALNCSATKTPIQKWGWEYLLRQRSLHRPLSPHLTVYKPQLTWMVSGLHRMTGVAMGCALIIGSAGFMTLPLDFTMFIDFFKDFNMPSIVYAPIKFVIAFPIIFHTLNGIRFLGFDLAKGTDIKSVYKTGWAVLAISAVLALVIVFMPKEQQPAKHRALGKKY